LRIGETSMKQRLQKGFTYIELLIYISIVTMMMVTLVPFAWNIIGSGAKSATQQEVVANARYMSERMKYEIRNASGIASVSANRISLNTANVSTNPTVIALSGGNLTISFASGSAVNLNSQKASISALTFSNYTSTSSATKHIQFVFTVNSNYAGAGQRQEYKNSTTVEGSSEVRSN
jgi:type II secretory pathway pseudopilin PulG